MCACTHIQLMICDSCAYLQLYYKQFVSVAKVAEESEKVYTVMGTIASGLMVSGFCSIYMFAVLYLCFVCTACTACLHVWYM